MAWWFAVVEARHEIQNPTSAEKIRLLGERLGLGAESHVLDMAAGRGGPAVLLAREFGCRVTCVEKAEEFVAVARERVREAGVDGLVGVHQGDGREFALERGKYDVVMCLGAAFIWGGLEPTVAHLRQAVKEGGFVVVGEPYWYRWPLPEGYELEEGEHFTTLAETAERFEACGVELVSAIASSQDEWDRYETLHWLALDEWLRAHPDAPEAASFREMGARYKDRYLRWQRDSLGWVILVGRAE